MDKIMTKALKSVAVTILYAIITTAGIILVEYNFYAGILFIGLGVGLFIKQPMIGKGKKKQSFNKSITIRKGLLLNGTLTNAFGDTKLFPIEIDIIYETQSQYKIDMGYWNGGTYWVKRNRVKII